MQKLTSACMLFILFIFSHNVHAVSAQPEHDGLLLTITPILAATNNSTPNVCDSTHLNYCKTESSCSAAGGYWYNNTCNLTPQTISCDGQYEVLSAGQCWMDRNLGASRVSNSSVNSEAYGDLYQWGRGTDGHEKRTSGTTSTLSSSDTPGHGDFITALSSPYDWRSPQNSNLWQGVSGINNPCPDGFRLPTATEWKTELSSWNSYNSAGAYGSPLKLVAAGYRGMFDGESIINAGFRGGYWSSTAEGSISYVLYFDSGTAFLTSNKRRNGFSIRCIKD